MTNNIKVSNTLNGCGLFLKQKRAIWNSYGAFPCVLIDSISTEKHVIYFECIQV